MPNNKRPIFTRVSNDQVRPLLDHLLGQYESRRDLTLALATRYGRTQAAWEQVMNRIGRGSSVDPTTADILATEADMPLPPFPYKQTIYKVSGYYLSGKNAYSIRTWYYTTKSKADARAHKLRHQKRFLEYARSKNVVWDVIDNSFAG